MNITLNNQDATAFLQSLEANSIDSIVTDPPYGWSFMGKKWDYDLPSVATFQEMLRVLKPGGHILCACGTRTQHRMAVNIEDAGFQIRDVISWVYGSGFPKSQNIGKAVDKLQGNKREVVGYYQHPGDSRERKAPSSLQTGATSMGSKNGITWNKELTQGHTQYEGFGTALKPAVEYFTLARKPISEKNIAENVLKWGTGGLNIDGCRVGTSDKVFTTQGQSEQQQNGAMYSGKDQRNKKPFELDSQGRFPANFIHDGSDEVVGLFPNTTTGSLKPYKRQRNSKIFHSKENTQNFTGDSGSAARFFYCAKASKAQRTENGQVENNHPTVKPLELMKYLCRLITPPEGTVLDPYMGSGTTGVACIYEGFSFIGNDADSGSLDIAEKRIALNRTNKEGTQLNLI